MLNSVFTSQTNYPSICVQVRHCEMLYIYIRCANIRTLAA